MKRFLYAAAALVLTGVLVLLAMAIAQRDARVNEVADLENELPYANQQAEPILGSPSDGLGSDLANWPPAPIVRGNDSPPLYGTPTNREPEIANSTRLTSYGTNAQAEDSASKPLAEPPPFSALNSFPSRFPETTPDSSSSPKIGIPPSSPSNLLPSSLPPFQSAAPPMNATPSISSQSTPNSNSIPAILPSLGTPRPPSDSGTDFPSTKYPATGAGNLADDSSISSRSQQAGSGTAPPNLPSYSPNSASSAAGMPSAQTAPPQATLGLPQQPNGGRPIASSSSSSFAAPPVTSATPPNTAIPFATAAPLRQGFESVSPSMSQALPTSQAMTGNAHSTQRTNGFASAAPGLRQLEGSQNPSLEIQKRAPSEVQVGIPATFSVLVRNVGNASAFDVNVVDAVPKGAKLLRTDPQAQLDGSSGLTWKLGEMAAGAEKMITMELMPESEGEIGSVASVNFAAQASVRTISTQPKLLVKQLLEPVVLGGESVKIMIDVSNVGTGTARGVRLEEDVPQNMRHSSGAKVLELSVGDLAPGESQKYDIELTAVAAGKVANVLRAVAENATPNESSSAIEVVSPKLQIGIDGPKLRYLERQATYTASITNTGTAIATNVDLILYLPSGLQFNSAENSGEYIANQHAVMWQLAELAAGKTAATKVTLLPVEEGDFVLRTQATADSVRAEAFEKPVRVEGQSELAFSIEDDNDPIETDGKTTYVIKIVNTGTRVDNDVQLMIDLPDGAVVEQVDAPVNYQVNQKSVHFSPIIQMKSKDQQTIRLAIRHTREGTHVLRAQLKSQLRPGAVIKEESTQVYRDQ